MTAATIANRKIRYESVASPQTFTDIPEVLDISGFGVSSDLVETTNLDSAGTREYISGLADGAEFDVECNHLDGNTAQEAIKTAQGTTINMQYARTDVSPETTGNFAAVVLAWEEIPSVSEQNRITFRFKITGAIT